MLWATIGPVRSARMTPSSGMERYGSEQLEAKEQVEFVLRWALDLADLRPIDRIIEPASDALIDPIPARSIYDIFAVLELGQARGLARAVDEAVMKDIRLAFRALLLADPTVNSLVGGTRVYPVRPPQTQRAPSLVYLRIIDFSDYNMLGNSGLQRTSMQLDAWADTHDASVQLADAAHDAISGFRGRAVYGSNSPQDYVDIRGIFQNIGRDLTDDLTQMFRMSRDYTIAYAER